MSITLDYLPGHKDIQVYQDDEMFRINSDTKVLGEFIEANSGDTILDIGTNNGALLLYASLLNVKKLIGIDINEAALDIAKKNMETNNITNYELICSNANCYRNDEVDVIVCNPPYFKTREEDRGKNPYVALAKHEDNLPLANLIATINLNLRNNGKLFFLFQTSRLFEVTNELEKKNITIKKMKFVYDVNKEFSNVVLIKAVKGSKKGLIVEKPIIITR